MNRIIERVERDPVYRRIMDAAAPGAGADHAPTRSPPPRAQVAHTLSAAAIVTYTTSGSTTLRVARERPDVPILCLTAELQTARRMALVWGAHSVQTAGHQEFRRHGREGLPHRSARRLRQAGERLVITAGVPFGDRMALVGDRADADERHAQPQERGDAVEAGEVRGVDQADLQHSEEHHRRRGIAQRLGGAASRRGPAAPRRKVSRQRNSRRARHRPSCRDFRSMRCRRR